MLLLEKESFFDHCRITACPIVFYSVLIYGVFHRVNIWCITACHIFYLRAIVSTYDRVNVSHSVLCYSIFPVPCECVCVCGGHGQPGAGTGSTAVLSLPAQGELRI